MAIQADGKIVVAGTSDSDDGNFALARYNDDGTLDPSFSVDGWQTTDFGDRDYGHSMALGADGRIVVAGESAVDFALARYNPDGTLDSSFSGDGKATTDVGGLDRAFDVALQPDGKIVAAGTHNGTFALARYEGGSASGTAPTNSAPPTILGTATDGQTLTVNPGTWSGSETITRSYQWRRCDSAGANCLDIASCERHDLHADRRGRRSHDPGPRDGDERLRLRLGRFGRHGSGEGEAGRHQGHSSTQEHKRGDPGASVNCGSGNAATSGDGRPLLIQGVAPGTYSCTASANGYVPSTQTVAVSSGQTTTANFRLVRR